MRNRRTRRIVLASLALLGLLVLAACGPASPAEQNMVDRHNYVRNLSGIGPLNWDPAAEIRAEVHANRLAAGVTSCGSSSLWHSPELASWYAGMSAGENAACVPGCPSDGKTAFEMWLNSPGHRANIYRAGYHFIGVAAVCNGSVQMVVAQYHS